VYFDLIHHVFGGKHHTLDCTKWTGFNSHIPSTSPSFANAGPLAPAGLRALHPTPTFPSLPFPYLPSPPVTSLPLLPLEVGPLNPAPSP